MAVEPTIYVSVYLAVAQAMYSETIDIVSAAETCHFAAQPNSEAEIFDILEEVKAELYDWIPSDLAALKEAHIIQITGVHRDGTEGIKCAQVASLGTDRGWHGGQVHASRVNINTVMDTISRRYLPEGVDGNMIRTSNDIDWIGPSEKFKQSVEAEVEKFRKTLDDELNFLFPGKEE